MSQALFRDLSQEEKEASEPVLGLKLAQGEEPTGETPSQPPPLLLQRGTQEALPRAGAAEQGLIGAHVWALPWLPAAQPWEGGCRRRGRARRIR